MTRWWSWSWLLVLVVPSCSLTVDTETLSNGVCKTGYKACNGKCVSALLTENSCGEPNKCSPCFVAHADPLCTPAGKCGLSLCQTGYADCNNDETDGCEIDTDFDVDNCGKCSTSNESHKCPLYANAKTAQCVHGFCGAGVCQPGFADCDNKANTGCETNVNSDPMHCGNCLTVCPGSMTCNNGKCQ